MFGRGADRAGHFGALHGLRYCSCCRCLMGGMSWLRRRGAEPATLAKMTWGYVATAAAFVVLLLAGHHGGDTGRVGPIWLGGAYLLLSAAELLLSPLGMSLITRIATAAKDVAGGRAVVRGGSSRQRIGRGHRLALGTLAESPLLRTAGVVSLGPQAALLVRMRRIQQTLNAQTHSP